MKKSIAYFIVFMCAIVGIVFLFEYITLLQDELQNDVSKHYILETLQLSKQDRIERGLPPNKYFEEMYLLQMNPKTGRTYPENIYKVQQKLKQQRLLHQRTPGDAIDNQWVERGPNNVGGRTRMVMFDPNDDTHKRVFAGGVSGGLWVNDDITDVNSPWTRIDIDDNLSVTCMAVDPNNSQIMYIGTGELYNPQQALGNGIWKSTDGGATWANVYQIRGTTTNSGTIEVPGTYFMSDIIVRDKDGDSNTTNDSEVFAAIGGAFYSSNPIYTYIGRNDYGIFKSTDEGENWAQITLDVNGNSVAPNDFEIGADNTLWLSTTRNIAGDGGGRIYNSTDGNSFTLKHTITDGRRTEIAASNTNANTLYVLGEVNTKNGSNETIAPYLSLLKTTDAFATSPTALALPNDATSSISAEDFTRSQAWYNLVIEVDPTNDAIAYVGGINLFRTEDSGVSWDQISKNSSTGILPGITVSYVHADQHSWAFHPTDANIAVSGNDGGVFYISSLSAASTSSTAIVEHTKGYITTQFYKAAIGQTTDPEYIIGGTQDNGNLFFDSATSGINSAIKVNRGDGTHCFIDKDGAYMIISNLYNNIYRYNLLPYTGNRTTISSDNTTGRFLNAMDLDDNLDILYSNGTNQLVRFTDITSNAPTRTNITDPLITTISAIKVSPFTTTSSNVYLGTRSGKLIKVENANTASPTITDISSGSFLGNISSVEFGASENEIMVTFYNFGVESIWFTEDGGITWSNKEGNFPDINVRCILMNPLNTDEVIIGTELGVWNTSNFKDVSPVWNQSYNGMSNVVVTSFSLRTADNTILASTYGRGMYTGKFKGNDLTTWTGNIDSEWTNANNWSNGLPSNSIDVNIPQTSNNPIINNAVSVDNITIESNASLTISALGSLTVEENSTNKGSFIVNSTISNSGSLIVKGTSTGNITYNRYVTDKWNLVSAPVSGQDYGNSWVLANEIQHGSTNSNLRGIATYNNDASWEYLIAGALKTFDNAKGYSIKRTSTGNLSFSGTVLTSNTTINIDNGATNAYNLVGNPYPAHLAFNENADMTNNFLTQNASVLKEQTVYVWNGTLYEPYNNNSNAYLTPGQAFFVISKPEGGTINFTKALQKHETASYLKQNARPELRLFLKHDKVEKYTDVFYLESATEGFDNGYDSSLFTGVSSEIEIYTKLINQEKDMNLAIQSIPISYSIVIPLGIIAPANKELEISLISKNIKEGKKIYLEDKKEGIFTLMEDEKSVYKFTSDVQSNGSGRFFIHTSSENLRIKETELSKVKYFIDDSRIQFLNLSSEKNNIKIYDVFGKLVQNSNLDANNSVSTENLPKAPYIFHLETENGVLKKKFIAE